MPTSSRRRRAAPASSSSHKKNLLIGSVATVLFFGALFGMRAAGMLSPGGTVEGINTKDPRYQNAEIVGTRHESEGNEHVANSEKITYKTVPPTSGSHWDTPAPWGVKERQLPDGQIVHNLEHGGVVINYTPTLPADQVNKLKALLGKLFPKYPKALLQPYAQLTDAKIAVSAWQWQMKLESYDEDQIIRFFIAHYAGVDAPEANAR